MINTDTFYQVENSTIIAGPMARPGHIGVNSDPAEFGYYPFWIDTPDNPGPYHSLETGKPTVDEPNKQVVRTDSWTAWPEDQVRDTKEQEILEQIPQYSATQEINDPSGVQANVIKATAAAQEKLRELDDSADPASVDPEIEIPDSGVGYALLSAEVTEQAPWVGTPQNIYGPDVRLEIQTEYEDQGSEARANVDIGGVLLPSLTFTQDTTNPKIWILSFPSDRLVADTGVICKVSLLWGAGSLRVGRELVLEGLGARSSGAVQYGVAG